MASAIRMEVESPAFLRSPRLGPGVCLDCFNLTDGYERCYACSHGELHLDAMVPISYSVGHEYLHHALAGYKRLEGTRAAAMTRQVAGILERFLYQHEACVAAAAGIAGFDLVTTVPSSHAERDHDHPLRRIVGELVEPTRARYEPLLRRTTHDVIARRFDRRRFGTTRALSGARVLLIDDTWTTGASAQSAAAALKAAGAAAVGAVVVGRHLNREWHDNDRHIEALARPFDWSRCALCAPYARIVKAA
jgi:predicted amidophosphoribosyltransferase